jgi:hypothetical protein
MPQKVTLKKWVTNMSSSVNFTMTLDRQAELLSMQEVPSHSDNEFSGFFPGSPALSSQLFRGSISALKSTPTRILDLVKESEEGANRRENQSPTIHEANSDEWEYTFLSDRYSPGEARFARTGLGIATSVSRKIRP